VYFFIKNTDVCEQQIQISKLSWYFFSSQSMISCLNAPVIGWNNLNKHAWNVIKAHVDDFHNL